jgi:hypothetical protein
MKRKPRRTDGLNALRVWFAVVTIVAATFVVAACGLQSAIRNAHTLAERNTYGGQRYTRSRAESLAGYTLPDLPDDEFLP